MSSPSVVVLDYGSGNLRSAQRALARVGATVTVTGDLEAAAAADGLVVPGVGAYAACMAGIDAVGAGPVIRDRVGGQRPVLGICVGMQVLFAEGYEHGVHTTGCGQWPGVVERLTAPVLPHMGWNTLDVPAGSRLLAGLDPAGIDAEPDHPVGQVLADRDDSFGPLERLGRPPAEPRMPVEPEDVRALSFSGDAHAASGLAPATRIELAPGPTPTARPAGI